MKAAAKANPMDTLRQLPENKKCFDCQQKGTMYCVMMNFHVFVCSACAGIHREMTHKVKGISMCVFSDQELKDLTENGNANQQVKLMKKWKAKNNPIPDKTDTLKMKEFMRLKYVVKQFAEESEEESSDSEAERRKKKKKKDRKKKKVAKKAASSSSEEEAAAAGGGREEQKQEEDSDGGEEPMFKAKKGVRKRGLGAPPSQSKLATPAPPRQQPPQQQAQPVEAAAPAKKQKVTVKAVSNVQENGNVQDLLDFGSGPAQPQTPVASAQGGDWGNDWTTFNEAPAQQQPPQQQQFPPQQPPQQHQQQFPPQQPPQQQPQPVPQSQPQPSANMLDDVFNMPAQTQAPLNNQVPGGQPAGGFVPNQGGFQPGMMQPQVQNMNDPFQQLMAAQQPAAQHAGMRQQPGMGMPQGGGVPQMGAQPMGGQGGNPQQVQMMQQQMQMMQQRMQQMGGAQPQQQNPQMVQQMQQQMQMMMQQMNNMMMQPGAGQGQMGGAMGMPQQQQPGMMGNNQQFGGAGPAGMGQGMAMAPPAQQDSLSALFNEVKKQQPNTQPKSQQNNSEYNPFDM